ncbi:MAG: hypothetical protein N3G21_02740 [Candidatus Hydrogenedentes bacterium]|nr:hypothetical protein [Candidatus Hydrogenedentota bacterium]
MWKNIHINKAIIFIFTAPTLLTTKIASSQDIIENLLDILPLELDLGSWSIYEVKDNPTKTTLILREAITGEEYLNNKKCYWLETEIIPIVGFASVYRFLIQPESEGKHSILKIVTREGANLPETYNYDTIQNQPAEEMVKKKLIGEELIEYRTGKVRAKHYNIEIEHKEIDIWVAPEIKPLGLVRLRSKDGEMTLVKHGKGGVESKSSLLQDKESSSETKEDKRASEHIDVKVEK